MKLGIITDIHSNIIALNEILKQFEKIKIDKIICCGDIIGIGPKPDEVVQALIQVSDKLITVRGNHEKYFLEGLPVNVHDDKINVKQLAIPYNVDKVIKEIKKLKFPFYEGILKIFYGDRN